MNITINTDASFCPHTKVSSYAFYIVCNKFKIKKAGLLRGEVRNPVTAESMAIGNALAALLKHKDLGQIYHIVINTDCTHAINNIECSGGLYKQVRKLRDRVIKQHKPIKLVFKHVKAHNGAPDARSWVNEWCDTEAKKVMRKQRNKIIKSN